MFRKRFPFSMQHDTMQCGVACLKMICMYYGKDYSLNTLSQYCSPTNEGVSLLGISEAAQKLGLKSLCGRMSLNSLKTLTLPCILHWDQNHFVVLYKLSKNNYYIADPGKGLVRYSNEDFSSHWISTISNGVEKGIGMLLEPTVEFNRHKENAQTEKRSFRFLLEYVNQYKRYFLQIVLGLFLGCLIQLALPFMTQSIVDVGIGHRNIGFIWLILLGQLMLTVSCALTDYIRRWLLLHISLRINISLVSDFFIKLLRLPMSFFDTKQMGDIMQRIDDHIRVEKFLTNQTLNVLFSFLTFLVFSMVLFLYNKLIFFIFVISSLIYGGWMTIFLKRRKLLDYDLFEKQAINNNKTYEFITTMQEIKLQDCEKRRRWEWEDIQAEVFKVNMKSLKLQQTQETGSIFINEVKNIVITVISATAVISGELTLGMMLAVQYIIGQLNSPIDQIMHYLYAVQDVKIGLERINEIHVMSNEDRIDNNTVADDHSDISFNHVSFKYDIHSLDNIINNVSFTIPNGKITAIVGASGSGKTTLLKLLLGYYPVSEGDIMIGDENINDLNKRYWRQKCGVVMQEGVIFSESIARNIAILDEDIDTDRLVAAAKMACIHDYVMSLPMKYNTIVGKDGVGLSLGQRQRILIARAIYRDPRYIFLDEATNSLDAKNERDIVKQLDSFYEGRTVLVIAHRLSTVRNADQIIVLDKGSIVELGNHDSLIAKHGVYYNLVKNQLELGN